MKPERQDRNSAEIQQKFRLMTEYDHLKYEFWKGFVEYANSDAEFAKYFTTRKPHIKYWYDLSLGLSAYHICLTVSPMKKEISAGIYFEEHRDLFEHFLNHKDAIEAIIGKKCLFKTMRIDSRIRTFLPLDVSDPHTWPQAYTWLVEMCLKFREVHLKFGK